MMVEVLMQVVSLALVATMVAAILLFRSGRLRWMGRWYFQQDAPLVVRHLPFVALPMAVYGLMTAGMLAAVQASGPWPPAVTYAGTFVGVALLTAAVWAVVRPPRVLKPRWLRDEERERQHRSVWHRLAEELEAAGRRPVGARPRRLLRPPPIRFTDLLPWGRRQVPPRPNGDPAASPRKLVERDPAVRLSGNGATRPQGDADQAARNAGWGQ
ncbi:MAG TPA: hypothetical protein VHF25_14520 [Nitriliruptorales bacterium]|nr:hypothetical protein [Nitriliruptorales bacterium]